MSPGRSHWYRRTGGLGSKFLRRPSPRTFIIPSNGPEGSLESPGDAAERASLVPQVYGLLQLLRIDRPTLGAANAPSIRQCRWSA